jgi:AraC-like DNA-binding protein
MTSIAVRYASNPEEYAAALRPGDVDLTITGRGRFDARNVFIGLSHLNMQRGRENLARAAHAQFVRAGIAFLAEPGPSMFWNGMEVGNEDVALFGPHIHCHRLSAATEWGTLSLSIEDMDDYFGPLADDYAIRHGGAQVIAVPSATMRRLRWLHRISAHLALYSPDTIGNPDAADGFEQTALDVLGSCIDPTKTHNAKRGGRRSHQDVINRFRTVLADNTDTLLHIPEISRLIGVSSRTLRLASQEILGVSPLQYLLLRRMHMARLALRNANPADARVTEIATEYGFWELGRFAVQYRGLFGETPSDTLRRETERPFATQAARAA